MLKGLRRSSKHILWPLTIALVVTMGGYGVWYLVSPETGQTPIGVIRGQPVRLDEFIQTARAARAIAALGGGELERRELYSTAWQRIILHREAERMGVTASRQDLARFLAQWPAFQVDGRFNAQRYSQILGNLGLEPSTFENQIEKLLAIEALRMIIQNQALISPAEAARTYERMNEEIRVAYGQVGLEAVSLLQEIPEAELEEYYRRDRGRFQVQTEIEIAYLLLETESFADLPPDPAEIGDDPAASAPEAEEAEPQTATGATAAKQAAAQRADLIIRGLDFETSLEKPATEYSLEIKKSGYFSLDQPIPGVGPVPEIGRLVESMEVDEIVSYPVPVAAGFLIFQLTGRKDSRQREFAEAREEIQGILAGELRRREASRIAREKLAEIRNLMAEEERDFESAAEGAEIKTAETGFFTRQGSEDLPAAPQFVNAAFLTGPGEVSDLIPGEDGFFFLSVLERRPAPPMPEAEQERWEEITRQSRAGLLFDIWFNNLVRESGFSITNPEFNP